jgi:fumarate reductase flavoprotein subunit
VNASIVGWETDVAIVGAGIAGLVAANRAAELGSRVLVLEKGEDEHYPCNSRIATGALNIAHTDPFSDPALLRAAIDDDTEGFSSPALADALAGTVGRLMGWLRAEGARMIKAPLDGRIRWILAPPRTMQAGLDWKGRGPDVLLKTLAGNLKRRGGTLLLGTRARELCLDGKRCAGVKVQQGERTFDIRAKAVVLADGGFQGAAELVKRFISPRPDGLTQRSAGSGQGDALLMAEAAGARLTDASSFYGHLLARDSLTNPGLWPYPTMDTLVGGAIMVDGSGRRFLDEGLGGIALSNALARLADPLAATAVFDQAIWEGPGRAERAPPNSQLMAAGGTLLRAPDLAALAVAIEVPPDNLRDTVAVYNQAIGAGRGGALTPPRTAGRMFGESRGSSKRVSPLPIVQPPFYAIRLAAGISYTMGGIEIDARAQVIARDGAPFPGLYAAGACTGGIEGGPLGGYVGGYLKAATLGFIAAETIRSQAPTA